MRETVPAAIRSLDALASGYHCCPKRLPAPLARVWYPLGADDGTRAWYCRATREPQSRLASSVRDVATRFVGLYDANALTGASSMRVLGTDQWSRLLSAISSPATRRPHSALLDVGAGDGEVTRELAPLFDRVVTTELSAPMAKRLRDQGWVCHEVDLAHGALPDGGRYDTVSLLNVLDRTTFPFSLLRRARDLVSDEGCVVLAVPMPIRPVVLAGPVKASPQEKLPTAHRDWETGVTQLYSFLVGSGFRVVALSRAPYLSRGDDRCPVTALDDAIFVLQRASPSLWARAREPRCA